MIIGGCAQVDVVCSMQYECSMNHATGVVWCGMRIGGCAQLLMQYDNRGCSMKTGACADNIILHKVV